MALLIYFIFAMEYAVIVLGEKAPALDLTLLMQSVRSVRQTLRLVIGFTVADCVGITKVAFKIV